MKNKIKNLISLITCLLVAFPFSVQAFFIKDLFDDWEEAMESDGGSQIINQVDVSAQTGRTIINGEVKEGQATTNIEIHNIVNGKEIDPLEIATGAEEVTVKETVKTEKGKTVVKRDIEIDSEKETEDFEVGLESSEPKNKEDKTTQEDWWQRFVKELDRLLASLFNIF